MSLHEVLRSLPVVRGFTFQVPPYLTGSVLENRLGMQLFRAVGKHLVRRLRPRVVVPVVQPLVEVIARDGIVVVPDFLSAEQFREVCEELDALRPQMSFTPFRNNPGRLQVARIDVSANGARLRKMIEYLVNNPMIRDIAMALARVRPKAAPTCDLSIYRKVGDSPDNDEENLLHADLHSPTVKAFYYFNDVDETNGAFIYAKGSARLSWARLAYEYNLSVLAAKLRRGDQELPAQLIARRGNATRAIISPQAIKAMGIVETQVCVKGNTLVIANNMGFHRRGEFTSDRERIAMVINYRNLQKPFLS